MLFKVILISALAASLQAVAQPTNTVSPSASTTITAPTPPQQNFTVKQIVRSHKLVVVETNTPTAMPNGKIFLATFPDGDQCSLILKESAGTLLTLDASICEKPEHLNLKTSVEPSLVSVSGTTSTNTQNASESAPPPKNNASTSKSDSHWSFGAYYSGAKKFTFNDAKVTTSGGSGNLEVEFETESALAIGVSILIMEPHSWGFSGGAFLEPQREIKSVRMTGSGGSLTSSFTSLRPKIGFLGGELNANYRWEQFYIPFGLNISSPYYDEVPVGMSIQGGLGLQAGMGFLVTENASLELLVKTIGLYAKEVDGTDSLDYGYGTLGGVTLGGKYIF